MAKGKKLGLGIILGAIGGVITGILTAPKSGKETRQDLRDKAADAKGSAERKLKDRAKVAITSIKSGDDDNDDATVDQVIRDLGAIKDKIAQKAMTAKKIVK